MSLSKQILLLWLVLNSLGCSAGQVVSSTQVAEATPNARSALLEAVITLQREDGGWGMSPIYSLTIYADGAVVFEGEKNVKRKGVVRSKINQQELQQLIAEFEKINYFSLADRYLGKENCPVPSFDTPVVVTSFTHNGRSKKVIHDTGCKGTSALEKLTALENKIEEVVNTKQWIK